MFFRWTYPLDHSVRQPPHCYELFSHCLRKKPGSSTSDSSKKRVETCDLTVGWLLKGFVSLGAVFATPLRTNEAVAQDPTQYFSCVLVARFHI